MFKVRLFYIFLFFSTIVYSKTINISNETKFLDILSQSFIFLDTTKALNINDIKTKKFTINDKTILTYGYSANFNVWIKFTLENKTDQILNKLLEFDNALTTHIEFYDKDKIYKEGLFQISKNRVGLKPTFNISLNPHEQKTYYLKVNSYITSLIVALKLWDEKVYIKEQNKHQNILSLFFGAMFVLAIYNLFIYFYIKDISYLYYVLYIFAITLHQSSYNGVLTTQFLSTDQIYYLVKSASLIVAMPIIFLGFFAKSFLRTKQYPTWDKLLTIMLIMLPIFTLFFISFDEFNKIRNLFSVILLIYLMLLTIYSAIRKNRQAYFILVGWILFTSASIMMYLLNLGIAYSEINPYYAEIALVAEAIIFSLALADRIKELQNKKNKANMTLIVQQQFERQKLEKLVNEKTYDLKVALDQKDLLLKELNHRVKNNMQTIVSLIRLQNDKIDDRKIKELLLSVQNRINAMGHFHEMLYKQDNNAYVNASEYFHILIDDLIDSYKSDNISIEYDIKTNLKAEDAIYCGLIVNELVTNAFKYAFINKKGNIRIELKKELDQNILIVKDDGVGYDMKSTSLSLGTILIENLTKKQLKGKIDKDTTSGVKVKIKWK